MRVFKKALVAALALAISQVDAATFYFCWIGESGYTMTGRMEVDDAAMTRSIVTHDEVTRFKISGYRDGTLLGTWDMADRTADTTWRLHFDPATLRFLEGDALPSGYVQGWNANGFADDCGNPGFGFNSGNRAQDICVNGVFIDESGVDPQTPFFVNDTAIGPTCDVTAPLSKSPIRESHY